VAHEKDVLVHSSDFRIFKDEWMILQLRIQRISGG
jgi:hypothetical protein